MDFAGSLPVGSQLAPREDSLGFAAVGDAIAAALQTIEHHPCASALAAQALLRVSAAAAAACPPQAPLELNPQGERDALVQAAPHPPTADELDNFAIYDRYFGVRRVRPDASVFAASMLQSWTVALADAASAMLGRDEIATLLRAFDAMLARVGDRQASGAAGSWAPAALPGDDAGRVVLRWRTGHQLFALCAILAHDAFDRLVAAMAAHDAAGAAAELRRAATFTRALAAAMWYTTEFPIDFYLDVLRPTMEAAGAHGGFSGTANPDYARMQWRRERALEALFHAYGGNAAAWPADTYGALMDLREVEIETAEHHVLLAASKVRLDRSLAQKAHAGESESAVTALREKAAAVAADVSDRFDSTAGKRVRVCAAGDVPPEHPLAANAAGTPIVLCRAYGTIWACDAFCPHAGGDLADGHMAGNAIVCPMHGAKFDARTGAVLRGPAADPLRTYPVVLDGGDVYVELP